MEINHTLAVGTLLFSQHLGRGAGGSGTQDQPRLRETCFRAEGTSIYPQSGSIWSRLPRLAFPEAAQPEVCLTEVIVWLSCPLCLLTFKSLAWFWGPD